jgi:hypothetical protein
MDDSGHFAMTVRTAPDRANSVRAKFAGAARS